MHFEIPDDARIQIVIGSPLASPPLEAAWVTSAPQLAANVPAKPRRLFLKGTAVAALLAAAYVAGNRYGPHPASMQARAEAAVPYRIPQEAPTPSPEDPRQVPQAFAETLQQRPTVTPPPGAPGPDAGARSRFGLQD